jgi:hypothetical protein
MNIPTILVSSLALLFLPPALAGAEEAAAAAAAAALQILPEPFDAGAVSGYDKLLIDDVVVSVDDPEGQGLQPKHIERLREAAAQSIRAAVGERFPIVTEPGPGVLRVRAAITHVRVEQKPRTFLTYSLFGFIKRRIDIATGRVFVLVAATTEVEVLDAQSGRSLRGVADLAAADPAPDSDEEPSFRVVLAKLGGWTHRLVAPLLVPPAQVAALP